MSSQDHRPRACPLCDQDQPETFWQKGSLQLVRCRGCAMVYVPMVAEEFASGLFYDRRPFYLSPDKLESDFAPVRFHRELRVFRRWRRSGSVLDVGCSTGGFLYQLKTRYGEAYDLLGVDASGAALDHAESRGLAVNRGPFLESDFGQSRFDAITFWAVLEHLAAPKEFLKKAAELLKAGGYCFILVPNLQSLAVRLLGPSYRYIAPEHLNYFTPVTLKEFVSQQACFETVESGSTHFNPVVIWQDFRSGGSAVTDSERARLLKRTTAWKQNALLRPLKILYGGTERLLGAMNLADNLFIVLRKKAC